MSNYFQKETPMYVYVCNSKIGIKKDCKTKRLTVYSQINEA